jgi:hypothetical protein
VQDRFTQLVPALTKYGSTTVGLTLLVIGIAGLYETWMESAEVADQAQPALSGKTKSNRKSPAGLPLFVVVIAALVLYNHQEGGREQQRTAAWFKVPSL